VIVLPLLGMLAGAYVATDTYTCWVGRRRNRRRLYERAQARARALGLPLLVVGDPDAGYITKHFGRDYGCGTVCTDLTGCPKCPTRIEGPLEQVLPQLPARSHVIFVSATLEYVTDLPHCIRELERVAAPQGLFVVRVEPHSSTFWLYPGARWVLLEAPPSARWVYKPYRERAPAPAALRAETRLQGVGARSTSRR
jgi:hypothetical protein